LLDAAHLSHVLLLRSKVVETSSKLGVPSELGEGYSGRCELLCHFMTARGNLMDRFDRRGRSRGGRSEGRCEIGRYR
jgi:hypothetical protein